MGSDKSAPEQTFVEFDEADYNRMQAIKDRHGVTWRGMLIAGAIRLTRTIPLEDPPALPPDIPLKPQECDEQENHPLDKRTDDRERGADQ